VPAALRACGAARGSAGAHRDGYTDRGTGSVLAGGQGVTLLRELGTHEELREVVALQKTIWGFEDADLLPFRMLVVATKIGGQLLGAFEAGRMIAFCLAIPALKADGKPTFTATC